MKLLSNVLAIAAIASTGALLSCSAGQNGFSYQNVTITMTPKLSFLLTSPGTFANPAVTEFTAVVTNAPAQNITWTLLPSPNYVQVSGSQSTSGVVGSVTGTLANQIGATVFYTAPNSPPIYSGNALIQAQALGIPQGSIMLVASVPSDPTNPSATVSTSQIFQVPINNATGTAPVSICGLNPNTPPSEAQPTVAPAVLLNVVPHGTSFQFQGFCVGNVDTGVIYSVNGVVGGSAATGTITTTGLYTAPATVPAGTGNPVTVTVASHIVPTVTATSSVTIQ